MKNKYKNVFIVIFLATPLILGYAGKAYAGESMTGKDRYNFNHKTIVLDRTYIDADAENQTEQIIYKKEATATYERDGRKGFWDFLKWLLSNPITLAILLFLLLITIVLLILVKKSMKRKKNKIPEIEEEEDEEI